jgi:hypothetical protein
MAVSIVKQTQQVSAPAPPGQRVTVDSFLRVTNGPEATRVEYEVQQDAASAGYAITEGSSRKETLPAGSHSLRHWFVLEGPGTLIWVNCRIKVTGDNGVTKSDGFVVETK